MLIHSQNAKKNIIKCQSFAAP